MIAKKGKKSSNGNLVSRLGLIVSPSHAKPGLISRLELALSKGARLGKDIAVGFNSVNKVLEEMNARTRNAASNSSSDNRIKFKKSKIKHCNNDNNYKSGDVVIETRRASVICVCRDSPLVLQDKIVEAGILCKLPVCIVPGFAKELHLH